MEKPGNHVCTHEMANGIDLEVREIPGFGDRSEIGVFIWDQCVGTFIVDKKRSGNLEIKPTMMKAFKLSKGNKTPEEVDSTPKDSPSLTNITEEDDGDNETP